MEDSRKIDFVLTWVDGSDGEWLARRRAFEVSERGYSTGDANANGDCRYRDNGLLRYCLRAIAKFAPWVNRVFLITCGQKPAWLDESSPRLRFVRHDEYIPGEWLPTFHSNTIELNFHRLAGLSERFVLFNDDILLLRPVAPEFFFRGGLPVLPCDLGIPPWLGASNISRIVLNNSGLVKLATDVQRQVWRNWRKFFDVRSLGAVRAAKNLASIAVNRTMIQGCFGHLAVPHLKSTFGEMWRRFPGALERTSRSRFRSDDSVNHWLMASWNLVQGRFQPANEKRMGLHEVVNSASLPGLCDFVRNAPLAEICFNDKCEGEEFAHCYAEIAKAADALLPEACEFEKR